LQGVSWYVSSFIVKPNELVREQPYIAHNIELTRKAYGFSRIRQREFPRRQRWSGGRGEQSGGRCRTSGCGTGARFKTRWRQIQEIRTYYDFPDIDIDRYDIDGATREVMLARAS